MEEKILWAAIEDYAGLWEVLWEFGKEESAAGYNQIQTTVIGLFEKGFIELYEYNDLNNKKSKIKKDIINIINEKKNWNPPEKLGITFRISATSNGKKYYKKLIKNKAS